MLRPDVIQYIKQNIQVTNQDTWYVVEGAIDMYDIETYQDETMDEIVEYVALLRDRLRAIKDIEHYKNMAHSVTNMTQEEYEKVMGNLNHPPKQDMEYKYQHGLELVQMLLEEIEDKIKKVEGHE